jgi:DNA repair protein RecN (Recombination protein N)
VLESIDVTDIGVIVNASITPAPGLTVITGETGAGKTMLVTGLGLLWGGRAEASRVRHGCEQARVEGVIRVDDAALREKLDPIVDECGAEWDDDVLVLARTVSAEGRSRAFLGGRSVPAGVLARVAQHVVAVHGQDDQLRLLAPAQQRAALDRFAGSAVAENLAEYRSVYQELKAAVKLRADISSQAGERLRRAEELRDILQEYDNVSPGDGELKALDAEATRLGSSEQWRAALSDSITALRGSDEELSERGAHGALEEAIVSLKKAREIDVEVQPSLDRLLALQAELLDTTSDVIARLTSLDVDPGRLDFVEHRRALIRVLLQKLARIMNVDAQDDARRAAWIGEARQELAEIDDDADTLTELTGRIDELRARCAVAATKVSQARMAAAAELADRVTTELRDLAMPGARLEVRVTPRPVGQGIALTVHGGATSADRHGVDEIQFLLAFHGDDEARPLDKGASGGERSRIMLAMEVVLASVDPVPTMLFDEIDTGVGGRAAIEIGRRLARLSSHVQVLVVTHLPQVAAFADRHFVVRADPDGQVRAATVEQVEEDARLRELARMLAGLEESDTAMEHAAELVALGAAEQSGSTSLDDTRTVRRSGPTRSRR